MKIMDDLGQVIFLLIFANKNHLLGKTGGVFPRFLTQLPVHKNHLALPCI